MSDNVARAFGTRHCTTIFEPTMTKFSHPFHYRLVAPVATKNVATPGPGVVFLTVSRHRSEAAVPGLAELRTFVGVEEIVFGRRLHRWVGWNKSLAVIVRTNFGGGFVFFHEDVTDGTKCGKSLDALPVRTCPGDSVTSTDPVFLHLFADQSLKERNHINIKYELFAC